MLEHEDVEWTRERNDDGTWIVHGKAGDYDATRSGYSRRWTESLVLDALRGAVPYGNDTTGTSAPDLLI